MNLSKGQIIRLSTRNITSTQADPQVNLAQNGNKFEFTAYVSVFGGVNSHGFAIEEEAFKLNEKKDKFLLNVEHDSQNVIGKAEKIDKDEKGIRVDAFILTSIREGKERVEMMKEGIMDEFSIEMLIRDIEFDEMNIPHVTDAELLDFALVYRGSDPNTEIVEMTKTTEEVVQDLQKQVKELKEQLAENEPKEETDTTEEPEKNETEEAKEEEVEEEASHDDLSGRYQDIVDDYAIKIIK